MFKTSSQLLIQFTYLLGIIMYAGGILSHVVITFTLASSDMHALFYRAEYQQQSTYLLILPGLGLALIAMLLQSRTYVLKPLWLKAQYACMAALTINTLVFFVPILPEMNLLAAQNIIFGEITPAYQALAGKELLIVCTNLVPLLGVVILSVTGQQPQRRSHRRNLDN